MVRLPSKLRAQSMYLTRTPALPALRAQLAQSSRELGTVLLGLEAVRGADPVTWGGVVERDTAVRHARRFVFDAALGRIVDKVFHGSASMLVAQLVNERNVSVEELERIRALLDERLARAGRK